MKCRKTFRIPQTYSHIYIQTKLKYFHFTLWNVPMVDHLLFTTINLSLQYVKVLFAGLEESNFLLCMSRTVLPKKP